MTRLFRINDAGNTEYLSTDISSTSLVVIDVPHWHLHNGRVFCCSGQTTLGSNASFDVLLITPNSGARVHLEPFVRASVEANFSLFEGVAVSANGTPATALNRDRNSTRTSALQLFTGPTVTNTGTLLRNPHFGSGQTRGGEDRSVLEWILRANTRYLFRITSEATANDIFWTLDWYEAERGAA